jgi:hypothetical protein
VIGGDGARVVNAGTFNANSQDNDSNYSGTTGLAYNTAALGGARPSFVNTGTLAKTTGTGSTGAGATNVAFTMDNEGAVNVTSGQLSLSGGGSPNTSGSWSASGSGSSINFASGSYTLGSNVQMSGSVSVSGASLTAGSIQGGATLALSSGTVTLTDTSTASNLLGLTLSGGTLTGSGEVDVSGSFDWSKGTMSGSGSTVVGAGVVGTIDPPSNANPDHVFLDGRTLQNNGTLTFSSGVVIGGDGARVVNAGTFNANSQDNDSNYSGTTGLAYNTAALGGAQPQLTNSGLFEKTAGTGTTNISFAFSNPAGSSGLRATTGQLVFSSPPMTIVPIVPPANTAAPTISGIAEVGQTLTASNGSWSGTTPQTYSYRWQRCANTCQAISGATAQTYAPVTADFGDALEVQVAATNSIGSASAMSAATGPVTGPAPANSALPTIAGTAQSGQTLTASTGTWSSDDPITYSYQWQDCDVSGSNCVSISGASGQIYSATDSDVGHTVRIKVTATNSGGNASASSAATGILQPVGQSGCTNIWTGTANDSQWGNAGNWSSGSVPGSGDRVCIRANASATVGYNTTSQIMSISDLGGLTIQGSLTLTDAAATSTVQNLNLPAATYNSNVLSNAGTLDVTGSFSWAGGTISGAGSLMLLPGSTGTISSSLGNLYLSGTLVNDGTLTDTQSRILGGVGTGAAPGVLNNGGTLVLNGNDSFTYPSFDGTGQIENTGTLESNTAVNSTIAWPVDNQGTISATNGAALNLQGGGIPGDTSNGSWTTDSSSQLLFRSGSFALSSASNLDGQFTILAGAVTAPSLQTTASTSMTMSGGSLTLTDPLNQTSFQNLTMNDNGWGGGNLAGAATVNIAGHLDWEAGTMAGAGETDLASGSTATISGVDYPFDRVTLDGRLLVNEGALTFAQGQIWGLNYAWIDNRGTFNVNAEGTGLGLQGDGTAAVENDGLFQKTTGSGETDVNWSVFDRGVIQNLTAGTLIFAHAVQEEQPTTPTVSVDGDLQQYDDATVGSPHDVSVTASDPVIDAGLRGIKSISIKVDGQEEGPFPIACPTTGTCPTSATVNWTYSPHPVAGGQTTHTITMSATDAAGNTARAPATITVTDIFGGDTDHANVDNPPAGVIGYDASATPDGFCPADASGADCGSSNTYVQSARSEMPANPFALGPASNNGSEATTGNLAPGASGWGLADNTDSIWGVDSAGNPDANTQKVANAFSALNVKKHLRVSIPWDAALTKPDGGIVTQTTDNADFPRLQTFLREAKSHGYDVVVSFDHSEETTTVNESGPCHIGSLRDKVGYLVPSIAEYTDAVSKLIGALNSDPTTAGVVSYYTPWNEPNHTNNGTSPGCADLAANQWSAAAAASRAADYWFALATICRSAGCGAGAGEFDDDVNWTRGTGSAYFSNYYAQLTADVTTDPNAASDGQLIPAFWAFHPYGSIAYWGSDPTSQNYGSSSLCPNGAPNCPAVQVLNFLKWTARPANEPQIPVWLTEAGVNAAAGGFTYSGTTIYGNWTKGGNSVPPPVSGTGALPDPYYADQGGETCTLLDLPAINSRITRLYYYTVGSDGGTKFDSGLLNPPTSSRGAYSRRPEFYELANRINNTENPPASGTACV